MADRKDVFTVRERGGKNYWTKIGSAFVNKDGSLSVLLDALPLDGKLQIREPDQRNAQRGGSDSRPATRGNPPEGGFGGPPDFGEPPRF